MSDIGFVFVGMSALMVSGCIAWFFMNIVRGMRFEIERDNRYYVFEIALLNKIAGKKGIDLDKETKKLELIKRSKFAKAIEQEMLAEFGVKEDGRRKQ